MQFVRFVFHARICCDPVDFPGLPSTAHVASPDEGGTCTATFFPSSAIPSSLGGDGRKSGTRRTPALLAADGACSGFR